MTLASTSPSSHHIASPGAEGFADVLVGLQYGDEGKAKIIDALAPGYDVIARFNGGANAGHTIDTPLGRISLKQLPSGVFHPHAALYIGSGCAINLWKLAEEIEQLRDMGVCLEGRLRISARAALVQPHHIALDRRGSSAIGTTGNGIGPCYADRALRVRNDARVNLMIGDLLENEANAVSSMRVAFTRMVNADGGTSPWIAEMSDLLMSLPAVAKTLHAYIEPDRSWLTSRVQEGARVLFEGAQSVLLDVVDGSQPYVTSSHTVPAYAYVGGDLAPKYHRRTIGVAKAIMSRVGRGPFPSELGGERSATYCHDAAQKQVSAAHEREQHAPDELLRSRDPFDIGTALRMLTGEYGTGTGRPRRIGMLDLAQLREVVRAHAVDCVYLNKVDCLSHYQQTAYQGVPMRVPCDVLPSEAMPDVLIYPGLTERSISLGRGGTLDSAMNGFVDFVERHIGAPLAGIGLGPERASLVTLSAHETASVASAPKGMSTHA
ncbi:adenylosuccinate synthetase [Pandoraea pulmonicola]|uniref:Adenylosuccinate synthetase n=1 Tax=Pandoraea pulmonicola TaxID=93221 RepID=A0AAJ5D0E0_PANPU|nr:adenylosuccinate synthetase [Pandoraea pulmonicola]AJC23241.2 adenylosuccinate synthetase [Pandoraea pulmonicola]SUA90574.1 Adenylosuccinate synthetase [Pandoraea pulmonicola]